MWASLMRCARGKPSLESLRKGDAMIIDGAECTVQAEWIFTNPHGENWKEYVLQRKRVGEPEQKVSLEVERDDGELKVKFWETELTPEQLPFSLSQPSGWPQQFTLGEVTYQRYDDGAATGVLPGEPLYEVTYADYIGPHGLLLSIELSRSGEGEVWQGMILSPTSIKFVD